MLSYLLTFAVRHYIMSLRLYINQLAPIYNHSVFIGLEKSPCVHCLHEIVLNTISKVTYKACWVNVAARLF